MKLRPILQLTLGAILFIPLIGLAEEFNTVRVSKDISLTGRHSAIRQNGARPLFIKDNVRVTGDLTVLGSITANGVAYDTLVDTVNALTTSSVYTAGDGLSLTNNVFTSTLGTSIAASEITADVIDFDRVSDTATLDTATTIAYTPTDATDATGLVISFTNANDTTDGTDTVLELSNALSTQTTGDLTTDTILLLNQADTTTAGNTTVSDALRISNTGGSTITDGIQIGSGIEVITNALNIASTGVTTDLVLQNGETIDNDTNGTILTTLPAAGLFNVSIGNLKIGNGTPTVSLDGEDAYVEGTFESDGAGRFDAGLTVAGGLTLGNGGASVSKYISTSAAVTSANIAATTCADYGSITVNGANPGDDSTAPDGVVVVPAADSTGIEDSNLTWSAYVSADDTVTIRACNPTGSGINTADGQIWRVGVWVHQ